MLKSEIIKKIETFVCQKPRSIQEIAQQIGKNWRTADRYVEDISEQFGTIAIRVFRGGTRGALKIVYWAAAGENRHSVFQEKIEHSILFTRKKEDFSAFDIYQHIDAKNKKVNVHASEMDNLQDFKELLVSTEKQLLLFSGNLSFINLQKKKNDLSAVFDTLAKKGAIIRIICRVDIAGKDNVERLLSFNFKHGKEYIEIHHAEQPLRAAIIDGKKIRMKEVKEPTGKINELNKRLFIYYTINDKEWAEWLSVIFWKIFSSSLDARNRLLEINRIHLNGLK